AWVGLLKADGVINNVLLAIGVIHEPLTMMKTDFALYIGIVYSYLPFMILPLYSNLEKHDNTLLEAASDLGAGPIRAFLRITLPLSMPGILAGSLLVFIPAVGEYVVPELLGRTDQLMIATSCITSSSTTAAGRTRAPWLSRCCCCWSCRSCSSSASRTANCRRLGN